MARSLLTTLDNPYDPFVQHKEWQAYDSRMGYDTFSQLARLANVSHELSPADYDAEYELAIDKLLAINPYGNYVRVYESEII